MFQVLAAIILLFLFCHTPVWALETPPAAGIIVFEREQGMDKKKSNFVTEDDREYLPTGLHVHYINSRPGEMLALNPKNCQMSYLRQFQGKDQAGHVHDYLDEIRPNCNKFLHWVLARVRPGRKLYIKLAHQEVKITEDQGFFSKLIHGVKYRNSIRTYIDQMYFEGQVIYQDGEFLEDKKLRSNAPVDLPEADEYVQGLYLLEEWREKRLRKLQGCNC